MTRYNAFKAGDLVDVCINGNSTHATYLYRAYTGRHVVMIAERKEQYVMFCEPASVTMQAISQPGSANVPEWAR